MWSLNRNIFFLLIVLFYPLSLKATPNDNDEDKIKINVPNKLRHRGYRLLIEDKSIPLDNETVQTDCSYGSCTIRLLSKDAKTLALQSGDSSAKMLGTLRPRLWRISLFGGSAESSSQLWQKAGLKSVASNVLFELAYSFNGLGVMGFYDILDNSIKRNGITRTYKEDIFSLGIGYEITPLKDASSFFSRFQTNAFVAPFISYHKLSIADDYVKTSDSAKNIPGLIGGLGVRMVCYYNFWLHYKYFMTMQKVNFPKYNLNEEIFINNSLIGVDYAF